MPKKAQEKVMQRTKSLGFYEMHFFLQKILNKTEIMPLLMHIILKKQTTDIHHFNLFLKYT